MPTPITVKELLKRVQEEITEKNLKNLGIDDEAVKRASEKVNDKYMKELMECLKKFNITIGGGSRKSEKKKHKNT